MKNLSLILSLALVLIAVSGCQKSTISNNQYGWHPSIQAEITALSQQHILEIGTLNKNDGKYCFISYEGFLRSDAELEHTSQQLQGLVQTIDEQLKQNYAKTAVDLTKDQKVESISELNLDQQNYLKNKSELECLKQLFNRQIAKYEKKLADNRLSYK